MFMFMFIFDIVLGDNIKYFIYIITPFRISNADIYFVFLFVFLQKYDFCIYMLLCILQILQL